MKLFVFILSFVLFSPLVNAKNVELNLSIKWQKGNSTKVTQTKVIAKMGKEWTIPFEDQSSLKINMKADSFNSSIENGDFDPEKSIRLKGKIFAMEHGKEKLVATPEVITVLGKEATLTTENATGEYLELKILPVKFSQN